MATKRKVPKVLRRRSGRKPPKVTLSPGQTSALTTEVLRAADWVAQNMPELGIIQKVMAEAKRGRSN